MSTPAPVARRAAHLIGDDPLARILVQREILDAAHVERLFRRSQDRGVFLEEVILEEGLLEADLLREELARHFACETVSLADGAPDAELARALPRPISLRRLALPVRTRDEAFVVALAAPDDARGIAEIERALGRPVVPVVALRHELRRAIGVIHAVEAVGAAGAPEAPAPPRAVPQRRHRPKAPAAPPDEPAPSEIVDRVLREAVRRGATDVHFEPGENELVVRYRIDGVLHRAETIESRHAAPVTSRLKVVGGMDIAERRAPQDGRATLRVDGEPVDLRLSALPSRWGETVVTRLLKKDPKLLSLDTLGMPEGVRERHREMVESPMGLFLVTGPTGSGKTTTLYATLCAVDREALGVVTLEDPIEYELEGVVQVQLNTLAGLTFASGLRSILRQDPDVILVGEIRDETTAEIACQAALTGHAVLSTLHANDSTQAVTRLVDMGVAPHLVAATLRGSLAQRLLRTCCAQCRETRPLTPDERTLLGPLAPASCAKPVGCEACGGTGYRGRQGVYEYFRLDEDLQGMVLALSSAAELREAARHRGMTTLLEDGCKALETGITTFEEVARVLLCRDGAGRPCPGCGRAVREDFDVCPRCRHVLRRRCDGCHAPVEATWIACPACSRPVDRQEKTTSCGRCEAPLITSWQSCPFCGEGVT